MLFWPSCNGINLYLSAFIHARFLGRASACFVVFCSASHRIGDRTIDEKDSDKIKRIDFRSWKVGQERLESSEFVVL